jgi:hypothetical protein
LGLKLLVVSNKEEEEKETKPKQEPPQKKEKEAKPKQSLSRVEDPSMFSLPLYFAKQSHNFRSSKTTSNIPHISCYLDLV